MQAGSPLARCADCSTRSGEADDAAVHPEFLFTKPSKRAAADTAGAHVPQGWHDQMGCCTLHAKLVTLQGVARFAVRQASRSRHPRAGSDGSLIHYAIGDSAPTLRVGSHLTRAPQGHETIRVHSP